MTMYCAASSACYSSVGPGTASRGVVSRAIFAGRIRSPRRTVTDALLPIVPAVICRSGLPKAPTRSSSCLKAAKEKDGESSTTGKGGDDTLKVETLVAELLDGEQLGKRGEVYFLGQSALVGLAVFTPEFLEPLATAAGAASLLGGTALAGLALKDLGNSLSPLPKPRNGAKLVTSGVYGYVRHPMYAGLLLLVLGIALTSGSSAKFMLFLSLLLLLDKKASLEETFLADEFGEEWTDYVIRVSKILPFIY
mmetsp:Transcript_12014/g.30848  ORF Transcript_12014/g.30848 Transcript_12014/m.30848 type:complete len:251 (+) Transcript_12014:100-852(+)